MGGLKDFLKGNTAASVVAAATGEVGNMVSGVLDKVITKESDKLNAKNELTAIVMGKLTEVASFQRDVLVTELKGNKLQKNWRPIVMLTFAFIIVCHYFFFPVLGLWYEMPVLELPENFWGLLKIGLGGYVIGRSVEKVAGTVTKNVDMTFLKKKDRKAAKE